MPNSLYAATALRDEDFLPHCVPGAVWGPWWKIDRSDRFEPATAIVAVAARDPRDRARARDAAGFWIRASASVKAALVPRVSEQVAGADRSA